MTKYTFVVMTNASEGKEEEFNRWYNQHHIPDVLNVPGFVSGQRFRLAEAQMGAKAAGPTSIWRSTKLKPMIWRARSRNFGRAAVLPTWW